MSKEKDVKILDTKIFTYIWNSENHECFSNELMTKFSLSRQALYYHMKKLVSHGLVEKIRDYANLYKAIKSPYEKDVEKLFSLGVSPAHIRTHAIGYVFKILKGAERIKFKTEIKLNNWTKFKAVIDGCTVIKHPNKLIIYPPEQRSLDARLNEMRANYMALSLAQKLVERYDLTLSLPELVQKPHHAIVSATYKKIAQKVLSEIGTVSTSEGSIDDSEKTGQGEVEVRDADDVNTMLHMGRAINEVKNLVQGSTRTQNALANTQMFMASVLKETQKEIKMISKLVRKTLQRRLKEFL